MNMSPGGHRTWLVSWALGAAAIGLLVSGARFLTRPFKEPPWEEAPPNPDSIYENGQARPKVAGEIPIISPFHLQADPMGWTPGPAPRMARLLFRAVSTFRAWPTTYLWRGTIQLAPPEGAGEERLGFRSGWERVAT